LYPKNICSGYVYLPNLFRCPQLVLLRHWPRWHSLQTKCLKLKAMNRIFFSTQFHIYITFWCFKMRRIQRVWRIDFSLTSFCVSSTSAVILLPCWILSITIFPININWPSKKWGQTMLRTSESFAFCLCWIRWCWMMCWFSWSHCQTLKKITQSFFIFYPLSNKMIRKRIVFGARLKWFVVIRLVSFLCSALFLIILLLFIFESEEQKPSFNMYSWRNNYKAKSRLFVWPMRWNSCLYVLYREKYGDKISWK